MEGSSNSTPSSPRSPAAAAGGGERAGGVTSSAGLRKKGTAGGVGVRAWLVIDGHGGSHVVEAGKQAIMRRTGLPARDLRMLDPLLSYPSTILGRERAIVINLEHIKAIITAHEVLLLNSTDPAVAPFVATLQRRLLDAHSPFLHQVQDGDGAHTDYEMEFSSNEVEEEHLLRKNSLHKPSFQDISPDLSSQTTGSRPRMSSSANQLSSNSLPFEFLVLEACLEATCSTLDTETEALEHEAYPALDELAVKISTLNLERVRQLKSRLVAIFARVQAVRDELEQLLDDDGDMKEIHLTDKLRRQQLEGLGSPVHSTSIHETSSPDVDREHSDNEEGSSTSTSTSKHQDVEELEMLLEAYFVQTDGTLNKILALREYVDDTEDYINIMLDDKQNHILQMGVMMTTGTLVMSIFVVVTGIFGMNITISLFDTGGLPEFLWVVGGTATGAFFIYILVIAWCKHKRLLE